MLSAVYKKINHYLFEAEFREQISLMRIILCATMLYTAFTRQLNMDMYGPLSIISKADALSIYPEFYRPAFQYFFWPDHYAYAVHLGYIFLLLIATLGLSNRFFMLTTWVLAQGFINRNYSMLFGADLIGTLFLFYLSFTDCHDLYSIKNIFSAHKKNVSHEIINHDSIKNQVSSLFFRLMQVQIAVIYAYTGFEKLKGSTWWDGTALWTVFANPQFIKYDFLWLRNFPLFFTIGTFVTIVFEVYFPTMVMFKKTRYPWLLLGVLFHFMIGFLVVLFPFSIVMISTYCLFLETEHIKKMTQFIFRKFERFIPIRSRPLNKV